MNRAKWTCKSIPLDKGGCCKLTWEERDSGYLVERVNIKVENHFIEVWLNPGEFSGDCVDLSWIPEVMA